MTNDVFSVSVPMNNARSGRLLSEAEMAELERRQRHYDAQERTAAAGLPPPTLDHDGNPMTVMKAWDERRAAERRQWAKGFFERERNRDHEITPMEAIIEDNERLGNHRTATLLKGLQLVEAAAGGLTAIPTPGIVPARPVSVRVGNRVKIVAHQTPRGLEAFHPERDAMSLPGRSSPQKVHHGSPVMDTIDVFDVAPTTYTSAFVGGYGTSFSRGKNVARVYAIPDPPHRPGKDPGVISGIVKKGTKLFDANNDRLSGADFVDMLTKSEIADLQGRLNNPRNHGRGFTLDTIRGAPTIYEAISQITDKFKGAGPRSGANFVTDVFSRRGYDGISYRGSGANERETLLFNPATTFIETERTTTPPLTPKQQDHLLNSIYYPEFPRTNQDAKGGDARADAKGGDASGSETAVSETAVSEPVPKDYRGPRIVINPTTFKNKKDALCVAFNEAFRVVMEDMGFDPVAEPTDRQRKFFSDTAYADDETQLRRTILARIATFDTSVKDPTPEQVEETIEFLHTVLEIGAPQNEWEQSAVQRLIDGLKSQAGSSTPTTSSSRTTR